MELPGLSPPAGGYLPDTAFDQVLWGDPPALQRRFQTMFTANGADALLLPTTRLHSRR